MDSQAPNSGDVAIIGAGLVGLSIAFELAERGARVHVFERGEPGKGTSWAGAGVLSPYADRAVDGALLALCRSSLSEYPAFVERVRALSSIDPFLHVDGVMHAALDAEQLEEVQSFADRLDGCGATYRWLDAREAREREPVLGDRVTGAVLVESEGRIDNRMLGVALAAACLKLGVGVHEGVTSLRIEYDDERVRGVRTELGFTEATSVVNAAGAWASAVDGVPPSCVPPVFPVRGQMLAMMAPLGFIRHALYIPGIYFVPRDDGRLLLGATVEPNVDDARPTAEGIHGMLHKALAALPGLRALPVIETWAGLRPGTADGKPFLGPAPLAGYYLATGHYRNGILLAPATGRLLADAILGKGEDALAPFALGRDRVNV